MALKRESPSISKSLSFKLWQWGYENDLKQWESRFWRSEWLRVSIEDFQNYKSISIKQNEGIKSGDIESKDLKLREILIDDIDS